MLIYKNAVHGEHKMLIYINAVHDKIVCRPDAKPSTNFNLPKTEEKNSLFVFVLKNKNKNKTLVPMDGSSNNPPCMHNSNPSPHIFLY